MERLVLGFSGERIFMLPNWAAVVELPLISSCITVHTVFANNSFLIVHSL